MYIYLWLRPKPNRNTRLAQLWKPTLVAAVSLATKGWNSPNAKTTGQGPLFNTRMCAYIC